MGGGPVEYPGPRLVVRRDGMGRWEHEWVR